MARPRLGADIAERFQLVIPTEELEAIREWQHTNRVASTSEAIRLLVRAGLGCERTNQRAAERIAKLEADLAFADEHSAKVEALLEPHVKWDEPHDPSTIRICPMRDGPCPHGLRCPFVGESYMGYPCKDGWSARALSASQGRER